LPKKRDGIGPGVQSEGILREATAGSKKKKIHQYRDNQGCEGTHYHFSSLWSESLLGSKSKKKTTGLREKNLTGERRNQTLDKVGKRDEVFHRYDAGWDDCHGTSSLATLTFPGERAHTEKSKNRLLSRERDGGKQEATVPGDIQGRKWQRKCLDRNLKH